MPNGQMERMVMADGAEIGVYRAMPKGARRGGLVLIQEIFGVNAHIRDVADEYARDGYEVLAPALFDREHPGFDVGYDEAGMAQGIVLSRQRHPFDLSLADTQTCIDALRGAGPVFIVGYCYGGSVAWYAGTRLRGLAAASCYYGSKIPEDLDSTPICPAIVHFGRHDHGIPLVEVEKLIAAAPARTTIHLYEAGHGFNCDRRADYDAESAALAKARTLALFRENGG